MRSTSEQPNVRAYILIAILGCVGAAMCACTSSTEELDPRGKVGESCPACDDACGELGTFAARCDCDECLWIGFDPDAKLLLSCPDGTWEQRRACPGGVSVACAEGSAYKIECLDENGAPLPLR